MTMSLQNQYQSDNVVEIVVKDGKRFLKSEPRIEEISKQDIKMLLQDVIKNKPKQVSVGEFKIRHCDACSEEFILHKRQTFCPVCKRLTDVLHEDANIGYDEIFQVWQGDKNFLENILYGNKDASIYAVEVEEDVPIPWEEDEDKTDGKWIDSEIIENFEPIVEELK